MARTLKTAIGSGIGLLIASALTAIWLRRKDQEIPEAMAGRIEHLILLINQVLSDPDQSDQAARLNTALRSLDHAGVHPVGSEWGFHFTQWELWGLRLRALARGKPSEASLQGLEQLLEELEEALERAGVDTHDNS